MINPEIDVQNLPPLSNFKQAAEWVGTTDRHIANEVKAGRFPKPIYAGKRSPRFRRSDLLNWLDQQSTGTSDDT